MCQRPMIDLHSHILPGLDDGPPTLEGSIAMARVAEATGTKTIAATPHIREDFAVEPDAIAPAVNELNAELEQRGVDVTVVAGAEVALTAALNLPEATLRLLTLGDGPYILLESPYTHASELLEQSLFDLAVKGFRPVLAHPERSPSLLADFDRLARLVESGILLSLTAASLGGRFGRTVERAASSVIRRRVAHNVASDAHDDRRRPPDLTAARPRIEAELTGAEAEFQWLTAAVPRAMLAGRPLPNRPEGVEARGQLNRRFRLRPWRDRSSPGAGRAAGGGRRHR
jgi:protein-tyrosine phosphatase